MSGAAVAPSEPPFMAGSWAVVRGPHELFALDCGDGEEVRVSGEGLGGDWDSTLTTLRQLGVVEPGVQRLHRALVTELHEPLNYRTLLGRDGWEILFLELTGQCNERCRHCYAESSPERKEQLSFAEVESVVRQAQLLGVRRLQLTGGDPLVSRNCLPAARLARELGIPEIEIYTNGLALSDALADDLCALGASFAMSFYSHRPEVHDAVTGTPGSQVRTLAAIERVLRRGSRLRVSLISTAENRQDIQPAIELLELVGVSRDQMGLDEERTVGRGTFGDAGPEVPHALLTSEGAPAHGARSGGGGKLCVSYRGEVHPCIFARHQRLGSIRETTIAACLEAPLTLRARSTRLGLAPAQARLTCSDCRATETLLERVVGI